MRQDIGQGARPRTGPAGQWAFEAVTAGAVALGTLLAVGSAVGVLIADNLVVPVTMDPATDLGPQATAGRFALAPGAPPS